jgi:hypothetical protein
LDVVEYSEPVAAEPVAVRVELVPDADASRTDELIAALRRELLELDVERVDREADTGPEGAKGLEIGALLVLLAKTGPALAGVVRALQAWVSRGGHSVKVSIDGDTIELGGASSEQEDRLIAAWIKRQERR